MARCDDRNLIVRPVFGCVASKKSGFRLLYKMAKVIAAWNPDLPGMPANLAR